MQLLNDQGIAPACSGMPGDMWFPTDLPAVSATTRRALALCGECPLTAACLQFALDRGIDEGIWGGTLPSTRSLLKAYLTRNSNQNCESGVKAA